MNFLTKKELKIILSGLDNAGKTSMLLGIQKLYEFEEKTKNLKPTVKINYFRRKFLNYELNFFDMGGQKRYRDSYIKRKIYFDSSNLLIFLIDIQDNERFSESIEYLEKVLKILSNINYEKKNPIYICFSKSDYNILKEHIKEYITSIQLLTTLIKSKHKDFNFKFHSTSIFNIFSIVKMISESIHNFIDFQPEIQEILKNFSLQEKLEHILLFDHTGLIISDIVKYDSDNLEASNKLNNRISGHLEFFKRLENDKLYISKHRVVEENNVSICYQIKLYDKDQESDENSLFNNYYLSISIDIEFLQNIEKKIPLLFENIKKVLNKKKNE